METTAQQYAEAVIKTAMSNGMSIEDIMSKTPEELAEAHLSVQLKSIVQAGKQLSESV